MMSIAYSEKLKTVILSDILLTNLESTFFKRFISFT